RFGRADARGPTVRAVDPPVGAIGVARRIRIRVFIDEPTPVETVTADSIRMFKSGRRVAGRVVRDSARRLILRPARPLRKGKTYRVVVRGISDALGNIGPRFEWRFKTVAPPKKKRRR
ncbi:MAG: Ig-like domain-containing protein, partial [Actinomycetota bacterium]